MLCCPAMTDALRLMDVPVPTMCAFLEASAVHATSDLTELAEFAGFSPSTAKRAVPSLETLGLLRRSDSSGYKPVAEGLRRGMSADAMQQVMRRSLLSFRGFELLLEGLALEEPVDVAVRKTLLLLGRPQSESTKLRILLRWGKEVELLAEENDGFHLVRELTPSALEAPGSLSTDDLSSEAKARLFNARRLGREANNRLDQTDRDLLADALIHAESDPRKAVDAAGQALEDFLRELARDHGVEAKAKKLNGSGQLATMLVTEGRLHSHHQKMVEASSTMRNATAHRKDKKTLTPWEMTAGGAFSAHAITLTAIRSIHYFDTNGSQTI